MRYGLPPFADVKPVHFQPAFEKAMQHHLHELSAIVDSSEAPNFDNVIARFDRCGGLLSRTSMLFSNLCSSCAPPELQAVQLFIFTGSDAVMQAEEAEALRVFHGRLLKTIFWRMGYWRGCFVATTMTAQDFQKVVIKERFRPDSSYWST